MTTVTSLLGSARASTRARAAHSGHARWRAAGAVVLVLGSIAGMLVVGFWAALTWGPTVTISAGVGLLVVAIVLYPVGDSGRPAEPEGPDRLDG